MVKRTSYSGEDWLKLQEYVNSNWGKRAIFGLKRLSDIIDGIDPPYFEPGPNQDRYYKAYFDVIQTLKNAKEHVIFDNSMNRSRWHWKQLRKYKHLGSKTKFRSPLLNKNKVEHLIRGDGAEALVLEDRKGKLQIFYSENRNNPKLNKNVFCKCKCLILVFHDKRVEWYCPECGKVEDIFTKTNQRAINERWSWESGQPGNYHKNVKTAPKNYQRVTKLLNQSNRRSKGKVNKDNQASIMHSDYIKQGLNLKKHHIHEIDSTIRRLDYRKLYGNRSKLDSDLKTVCICLYVLEKYGISFRIGRHKFLKSLGLTNDLYKVIKKRIDAQLANS